VIEQSVEGLDAEKIAFDLFQPQPVKGMLHIFCFPEAGIEAVDG
jgi:hypothetical protein